MYKNRKERIEITETMNSLLLPVLPYLNANTAIIVKRALYLLGEIDIDSEVYNRQSKNIVKAVSE